MVTETHITPYYSRATKKRRKLDMPGTKSTRTVLTQFLAIPLVTTLVAGCASSPPVSKLREGVVKVEFIAHGNKPLSYSTGVIDASSFWAQYGGQVAGNLGGSALVAGIAASSQDTQASKADQNAEMVRLLVGESDIATKINNALLPQLAATWHVPYDPNHATVMLSSLEVEPKSQLVAGLHTDAGLVLSAEVTNINLTERVSVGSAFKDSFTFGMGKKAVTTEVMVMLRAFKPQPDGTIKQVWSQRCGTLAAGMKTAYHLNELQGSPEKMAEILTEATEKSLESCRRALGSITA